MISPAAEPYKVIAVATPSSITGTVEFEGTPPSQEVLQPSVDQNVCGTSIVAKNVSLYGARVVNAVVWLTDIRSGKAFPLERRFDLTNNDCMLDPYVQAITTGSTLNVGNDDRVLQTNRFINVGTGKIVAYAPFNDDGEVVPVDRFREPAEIEVVSEQHPWTHAWIAVLDHPYFAQTDARGEFKIDGVPPGKYKLRAWHPALGFADDSLTVPGGQSVAIAFRIRRAAPATPAVISPPDTARAASSMPAVPILPTSSSTPAASSTSTATPPPR